jgi:hypothetical protein
LIPITFISAIDFITPISTVGIAVTLLFYWYALAIIT